MSLNIEDVFRVGKVSGSGILWDIGKGNGNGKAAR